MATTTPADNVSLSVWVSYLRERVEQLSAAIEALGGTPGGGSSSADMAELKILFMKLFYSIFSGIGTDGGFAWSNGPLETQKLYGGTVPASGFVVKAGAGYSSSSKCLATYVANNDAENLKKRGLVTQLYGSAQIPFTGFADLNIQTKSVYESNAINNDDSYIQHEISQIAGYVVDAIDRIESLESRVSALEAAH